MSNIILIFPS